MVVKHCGVGTAGKQYTSYVVDGVVGLIMVSIPLTPGY